MSYNPRLEQLQKYPFERLRALTQDIQPNEDYNYIPLTLGEPKHAPPDFVIATLSDTAALAQDLASYPATRGSDELRAAIAEWLQRRFKATVSADTNILPVNGTREALFCFAQAMLSGKPDSRVLVPNPFYQIYEGAALLAGATPTFIDNDPTLHYQQNFEQVPESIWRDTELVYICSPGNPTGQIIEEQQLQLLITKAHQYDFIIAADECYSELYFDTPPTSLLSASAAMGNPDYARCVVFHSLSKRSNLPGLRSGFVAGDARLLESYLQYRTYHGCAMSPHHQRASALAWNDEAHVEANRALYVEKFATVSELLADAYQLEQPAGGFYHWLPTPIDDQAFAMELLRAYNVAVMPGTFLARAHNETGATATNPGTNHVRVAWVAPLEQCAEAARRLREFAATVS